MDRIVKWLESCGYTHSAAIKEANSMIERNRWDGGEKTSREFAIQMILDDLDIWED